MVSPNTEQYLKVIYVLTEDGGVAKTSEIASAMNVTPASVTEMLHKLSDQGYIAHEPYRGATLRPRGRRIACRMARRHRLLERFLNDYVGIKGRERHEQACKMEHVLTDEVEQNLCRIMNHPTECPHGRQIPRCGRPISCEKCTGNDMPLTNVKEGQKVVVSHLVSRSHDELCSMLAMGFVPGAEVKVEKRVPMGGPIIVSLKGVKIAIARDRTDILHVMKPT
ncbi:MAG: metal-dependent transcriptional regulator [Candidatus Thermoplasmatota archaeon]|nr:metal-dependent transcriptional regulator [Candidatus Thermoplasmatota archaeon]